jgi:hypothetical protein
MDDKDIETLFTYHDADGIDTELFIEIRDAAKRLGKIILKNGHQNVDVNASIGKLRECIYYAIASIVVPKLGD